MRDADPKFAVRSDAAKKRIEGVGTGTSRAVFTASLSLLLKMYQNDFKPGPDRIVRIPVSTRLMCDEHVRSIRIGARDFATEAEMQGLSTASFDDVESTYRRRDRGYFDNPSHGSASRPTEGKRR